MNVNFIEEIYLHLRNTILWFVIYLFLQAILWVALALLIWVYPQALFVLVSVFFVLIALISLYFAFLLIGYLRKLHKIKQYLPKV